MEFSETLGHWGSFAVLTGTAGATLAGLTFVAVTARHRLVQASDTVTQLRVHIGPTLLAFTLVLLLSCVLLLPRVTPLALALTLLSCGLYYGGYLVYVLRALLRQELVRQYDRLDWVFYVYGPFLVSVLLLLCGVLCLRGEAVQAMTALGPLLVALLLMGIRNALDVLMVTLNFEVRAQGSPGSGSEAAPPPPQDPGA